MEKLIYPTFITVYKIEGPLSYLIDSFKKLSSALNQKIEAVSAVDGNTHSSFYGWRSYENTKNHWL